MTHHGVDSAHRTTRRILGHVVRVRSDHPDVIDLADRAFAAWPKTRARPAIRLRFNVEDGEPPDESTPRTYELPTEQRLRIRGPGLLARADAARGSARVRTSAPLVRARDDFRYGVLEALTLFLLTARDRIPFHAAAIARGDTALLVSGPSGAGKSTFTWAALRARTGWRLLSEDCVYLQCTGESRVWGWPGYLHLGEGATRFFPELSDRDTVIRASGREKLAVAADASACLRSWRGQATLCLLERSTSGPAIEPLPLRAALARVTGRLEPGFDRFGASLPQALARTLAPDAWRVDAGTDPNRVPALLERLARATSEVR